MSPGLNVNPEELKKLVGRLDSTAGQIRTTESALRNIAIDMAGHFAGKAALAIQSASNAFLDALSDLAAEQERIVAKVDEAAAAFLSTESRGAASIGQTAKGLT